MKKTVIAVTAIMCIVFAAVGIWLGIMLSDKQPSNPDPLPPEQQENDGSIKDVSEYEYLKFSVTNEKNKFVDVCANKEAIKNAQGMIYLSIPEKVKYNGETYTVATIPDAKTNPETDNPEGAFGSCENLHHVFIPSSVSDIGSFAFFNCKNLSSVVMVSPTYIGAEAFAYCYSLVEVTIPKSVSIISYDAFSNDVRLVIIRNLSKEYVKKPSDDTVVISDIGQSALIYTRNYTFWEKDEQYYLVNYQDFEDPRKSITLPTNIDGHSYAIRSCAFRDNKTLQNVVISEGVTSIGIEAFKSCESLQSVHISSSVKKIGGGAFYLCKKLSDVTLDDGVQEIELGAFEDTALTTIFIPASVISIKTESTSGPFQWCKNLVIYCEVQSAPEGWDAYWSYYDVFVVVKDNEVKWGYSREEYLNEINLQK